MNFKHVFKEYFSYTTSEKKGLFVLVILLLILYILPFIFQRSRESESIINIEKQKQIDSLISSIENSVESKKRKIHLGKLEFFDPNIASKKQLLAIGFTSFQTNNLIKFREKGGRFKKKNDLLKIYGFDQVDLEYLNDYIQIIDEGGFEKKKRWHKKKEYSLFDFDPNVISSKEWERLGVKNRISNRIEKYIEAGGSFKKATDLRKIYGFDTVKVAELLPYVKIIGKFKENTSALKLLVPLNIADTTQLKQLSGIGSVLSARIVKYRDLLGGFISKDQILEVYGITKEKFACISSKIVIDSISLRKIRLNSFVEAKLRKHPYINSRMSKDIVRFRDRNGEFSSIDELRTHKIVPDSIFIKLFPYLDLK